MCCYFRRKSLKYVNSEAGTRVYIPFDNITLQFLTHAYSPEMTNNKLTKDEVDSFIYDIYQTTHGFISLRSYCEPEIFSLLMFLPLNIIVASIYSCFVLNTRIECNIIIGSIALFSALLLLLVAITALNLRKKKYDEVNRVLKAVIRARAPRFLEKNLRWEIEGKLEYLVLINEDSSLNPDEDTDLESIEFDSTLQGLRQSLLPL